LLNDTWVFENAILLNATVSPASTETNQSLTFSAGATGGTSPLTAQWNFGDGQTGANLTAHHKYTLFGNYTASLTATDRWGVQNSTSLVVTVRFPALYVTLPAGVDAGVPAVFSASVLNGTGTAPYIYTWSCPPLVPFVQKITNNSSATHRITFPTAGSKSCSFKVMDSTGTNASQGFSLVVNSALDASPTFSPTSPAPRSNVSFMPNVENGTPPYTFSWAFGDGGSSNLPSPTHIYTSVGSYTVQFWATDSIGASIEHNLTVTVGIVAAKAPFVIDWSRVVWLLLAVLLVIVIVIFLAIHGRRRPPGTPAGTPAVPPRLPTPPPGANLWAPVPPPSGPPPPRS